MGLHSIHFPCNLSATVSFDCTFELTGFEEDFFVKVYQEMIHSFQKYHKLKK